MNHLSFENTHDRTGKYDYRSLITQSPISIKLERKSSSLLHYILNIASET